MGTSNKKYRSVKKPKNSCDVSNAESCVYTIIGNINAFLRNKESFHHPNKKKIIKEAAKLLDDCFECKRSIYEVSEIVGTGDEISAALTLIDKQVSHLKKRMKPIAEEVSEYKSELERLAQILKDL